MFSMIYLSSQASLFSAISSEIIFLAFQTCGIWWSTFSDELLQTESNCSGWIGLESLAQHCFDLLSFWTFSWQRRPPAHTSFCLLERKAPECLLLFICWTDGRSRRLWHAMTQTLSCQLLLSACQPHQWSCTGWAGWGGVGGFTVSAPPSHPPMLLCFLILPGKEWRRLPSSLPLPLHPSIHPSFDAGVFWLAAASAGAVRRHCSSLNRCFCCLSPPSRALIAGPRLPASSLLQACEWGYISLSLWPRAFLSISRASLFLPLSHTHTSQDW